MQLFGVNRGQYVNVQATGQPENTITWGGKKSYIAAETSPTIRYLNRTSYDSTQHGAVPGRQYVVLSKNTFVHKKPLLVPYTLGIKVIGTAGEGAPRYVGVSPSPSASPSPGVSMSTGPATPPQQTPPATPPASSGVSLGVVVAVGAGALILGAAGAAAALAIRRRRRHR